MTLGRGGMADLVFDGREHVEGGVPPLPAVEEFKVLEDRIGELDSGSPAPGFSSSTCMRAQNDSMTALSKQSSIKPIDTLSPESKAPSANAPTLN